MNDNLRALVAALKSDEFTQTSGRLKADTSYCCLGVACELYRRATGKGEWRDDEFVVVSDDDETIIDQEEKVLPLHVRDWLGLQSSIGSFSDHWYHELITKARGDDSGKIDNCLTALNDSGLSFKEIATLIEANPPGLVRPKSVRSEERLAPGQSVCALNEEALSLGYAFYYAVDRDDVAEAEKVYQQIQELPTIYSGKEGQWL